MGDGKEVKAPIVKTDAVVVSGTSVPAEGGTPVPEEVKLDFKKKGLGGGHADTYGDADTPPQDGQKFGITLAKPKPVTPNPTPPKPAVVPKPLTLSGSATPSLFTSGSTPYIRPDLAHPEPGFQIAEKISDDQLLAWAQNNPVLASEIVHPGSTAQPVQSDFPILSADVSSSAPVTGTAPQLTFEHSADLLAGIVSKDTPNSDPNFEIDSEKLAHFKKIISESRDPSLNQFNQNYNNDLAGIIASGKGDRKATVKNVVQYQNQSYIDATNSDDAGSLINKLLSASVSANVFTEDEKKMLAIRVIRENLDKQYALNQQAAIDEGDNETVVVLTEGAAHDGVIEDDQTRLNVEVQGLDAVAEEDREEVADHIIENDHHEIDESNEEMRALHEQQVQQFVSYASAARLALFIARNADHSELIERASNKALAKETDPKKREALKAKVDGAVKAAKTDEVKAQVRQESVAKAAPAKPAGEGVMTGRAEEHHDPVVADADVPFGEEEPVDEPAVLPMTKQEKQAAIIAQRRHEAQAFAQQSAQSSPVVPEQIQTPASRFAQELSLRLVDPDFGADERSATVSQIRKEGQSFIMESFLKAKDPEVRKFYIDNNVISMGEIAEYYIKFPKEFPLAPMDVRDSVEEYNERNSPDKRLQESSST